MSDLEAHEGETQVTGEVVPQATGEVVPQPAGELFAQVPPAGAAAAAPAEIDGYCVKCKQPRTMQAVEMTRTKNGRAMAKGKCPVCGTTMTKFMKG